MPSRRAAVASAIGMAVMVLAGVLALAVTGAGKRTDLVFDTAVNAIYPVAPVKPGSTLCQYPFGATDTFDRVRFSAGTFGRPGPPLAVSVLDHFTGAELGRGEQPAGWVDNGTPRTVDVGSVKPGIQVDVCVRNEGRVTTYIYGDYYHGEFGKGPLGVTPTNSTNSAYVDGTMIEADTAMSLLSSKEHSALSWIPSILRHAATFKATFVGAWLYWVLGVLILVGAPLALWAALASASRGAGEPGPQDPSLPSTRRP
jgi:hypothetical protein